MHSRNAPAATERNHLAERQCHPLFISRHRLGCDQAGVPGTILRRGRQRYAKGIAAERLDLGQALPFDVEQVCRAVRIQVVAVGQQEVCRAMLREFVCPALNDRGV